MLSTNLLQKICFLLVIVWCCFAGNMRAQSPVYSQYYAAPLQLNPAFAGNTIAPFINMNYRSNWTNIPTAYQTFGVSYSQFFEDLNSGFGLTATTDDAGQGLIVTNRFTGVFSYKLSVNEDFALKFGVEAGFIQSRLGWEFLEFPDQIEEEFGIVLNTEEIQPDDLSQTLFDVSTGVLAYSKQFYGGITLKHINTPDESFFDINNNLNAGYPMRAAVQGGMQLPIGQNNNRGPQSFISPNILYTWQRDFAQLNIGAYASVGPVFGGLWYRHANTNADAVIFLAGFQQGVLKVGYSYDMTVSSALNSRSGGSHEISVILNFDANRPRRYDYNDCFQMFR